MNLKRSLHLSLLLLLTLATAAAEVPSLINYQGRLVTADGAAQSGQKTFLLEVFDAGGGGTLLYREEVGAITLGEGGVYSFQFGGSGTSNAQITETIGTGGEAVLYQQVLSNTPVVAGSVSVADGTYTWSQSAGSSNEDDFSAAFSTNLNRITVNYFSGAPNDGRSIDVTYRYESEGIVGALSSGGEHWLQLTIDGDVQATRERVLAVPFALRAGGIVGPAETKYHFYYNSSRSYYGDRFTKALGIDVGPISGNPSGDSINRFPLPSNCTKVVEFTATVMGHHRGNNYRKTVEIEVYQLNDSGTAELVERKDLELTMDPESEGEQRFVRVPLDISVNPQKLNFLAMTVRERRLGDGAEWFRPQLYGNYVKLTYEE